MLGDIKTSHETLVKHWEQCEGVLLLYRRHGDDTTADRLQASHRNIPRAIEKTSPHLPTTQMARNTHRILFPGPHPRSLAHPLHHQPQSVQP